MHPTRVFTLLCATLGAGLSLLAQNELPAKALPAFPGAEGFGAHTPGGRGGRVIYVTNLVDSGPGSLRAACEAEGPRVVLFKVSGTITLRSPIVVRQPFLTVAGQSAPGGGICVRDHPFQIATHDVVVRYLRSRLGDESGQQDDAIDLLHGASRSIIDHCSASWSVDECLSLSGNVGLVTVQWCLIGESLKHSRHKKGDHGFGSLARANGPVSLHHNLWLHNDSRNPRMGDNYGKPPYPFFDFRNNVIYDYGETCSGLTQGNFPVNYVNNYIKPGPSSKARTPISVGEKSTLRFFIEGNIVEGRRNFTEDNRRFFSITEIEGRKIVEIVDKAFPAPAITQVSADKAYELVLASVGASKPMRDKVDLRLIEEVRTGKGSLRNSEHDVGGWPELVQGEVPVDSDGDGMPDLWEKAHGLDPKDSKDGALDKDGDGYTNLEDYLNALASTEVPVKT